MSIKEVIERIGDLMDAKANTPEGDELDILVTLVAAYEEKPMTKEVIERGEELLNGGNGGLDMALKSPAIITDLLSALKESQAREAGYVEALKGLHSKTRNNPEMWDTDGVCFLIEQALKQAEQGE